MMMTDPRFRERLKDFQTKFGVNIFKDVQSLSALIKLDPQSLALGQPSSATAAPPQIILHLAGSFNPTQLLSGLTQAGNTLTRETLGEVELHVNVQSQSSIAFIKGGVLMGTPQQLRAALSSKEVNFGGALAQQQKKLEGANDLWFAIAIPEALRASIKARNPKLADAHAVRGSLDLAEGMQLFLATEFNSIDSAARIAEVINARINQVKLAPQAAMFLNMINKLSVKTEATELKISLPLSQDDMNQIQAIVSMIMMSMTMNQAQEKATPPQFPKLTQPTNPSSAPSSTPPTPVVPAPIPTP
jgi:hypothetical protein